MFLGDAHLADMEHTGKMTSTVQVQQVVQAEMVLRKGTDQSDCDRLEYRNRKCSVSPHKASSQSSHVMGEWRGAERK